MTWNIMHIQRISFVLILLALPGIAFAQKDSRYASDMNLPFNDKAGDYNPQTGDVTLSAADVSLTAVAEQLPKNQPELSKRTLPRRTKYEQ
ncbi:MAG: hypothetical protein JXD23_10915 [Spirochaetales bacterium]|nr:hypothetical protein [Spirochaetales bacterium]